MEDRGRSRSARHSRPLSETRSATRSQSPRRDNRSRTRSRSLSRGRTRSRSRSRSRGARHYHSRSPSRSLSPNPSPPKSSKVGLIHSAPENCPASLSNEALTSIRNKIVVEKLTKNVTENHVREIFGGFGEIEYLDVPINKAFMTNRGTAYILYHDPADAEAAIAHMHEAQLDGAILNVSIVLPRRKFSRSPPPASNRGNGRPRYGRGPYAGPSSPRRYGGARPTERHDTYRPQSTSQSRSPVRSRSYSSRSRSPAPRRGPSKTDSRHRRRRSPSYSSYSSRSRSPKRNHGRRH
ncbi:unnamed protein product [Penicillium bialowiezense]